MFWIHLFALQLKPHLQLFDITIKGVPRELQFTQVKNMHSHKIQLNWAHRQENELKILPGKSKQDLFLLHFASPTHGFQDQLSLVIMS